MTAFGCFAIAFGLAVAAVELAASGNQAVAAEKAIILAVIAFAFVGWIIWLVGRQ